MGFEKEFEENMQQLMRLLKKMMSQYPLEGKSPGEVMKFLKDMKGAHTDVNIFFLNMMPFAPDEFEEIEEMFEARESGSPFRSVELKCELNDDDQLFLKKHGIRF